MTVDESLATVEMLRRGFDPLTNSLRIKTTGLTATNLTTTERDAIASPATGLIIWNTTTTQLEVFNGAIWIAV